MNIVIIDPSGTVNYCNGLADALSESSNVTVIARKGFNGDGSKYQIHEFFDMIGNKGKLHKGLNYVLGWIKTLIFLKSHPCDVVHIQWLLRYKVDILFLGELKKLVPQIVYTAHNVLPHVNGEDSRRQLSTIYQLVDKIIVHGEAARQEFKHFFPDIDAVKVFIQPHGADIRVVNESAEETFDIIPASATGKIFLYLGVIFHNKGVDRLLRIWEKYGLEHPSDVLVVAGMVTESNEAYENSLSAIKNFANFVYLPKRIEDGLHDYLYRRADIVLLPYYHASMSGVVFDAALFSKPILTTSVGCIPEYLENGVDSFIVDNSYEAYEAAFMRVLQDVSKDELKQMGCTLHTNIYEKYSWEKIAQDLINQVY